MRLSLVQMNSGSDDVGVNRARAAELIDAAVERDRPDLVVVPEFFNNLYFAQYRDYSRMALAERDDGPTTAAMRSKAREHGIHLVSTIFEEDAAGLYYDTAMLIDPEGEIVGKYRKTHPAAVYSLEKIYFRPGSHFPVFRVGDWRVGFVVCYDTFFPEAARSVAVNGAELIVVPFAAPEHVLWREIMQTRAFENGVYFAPCNKVGQEDQWRFSGHSMIVDPLGEVLVEAGGDEEETIFAEIERETVFEARRRYPMARDRRPDLYRPICTPTEDLPVGPAR